MERITISLDGNLVAELDAYLEQKGYANRSEAFRDLLRDRFQNEHLDRDEDGACVGCLTYIYDHESRELASRLTHAQHDNHDLSVSTLHVHLDHHNCLESVVLRGPVGRVRQFANAVMSQPGVRHGNLHLVPAEVEIDRHAHGAESKGAPHVHSRPRS